MLKPKRNYIFFIETKKMRKNKNKQKVLLVMILILIIETVCQKYL